MKFEDLRQFLVALEERDDLRHIDGAHWNLELGAITEAMAEKGGPALLFDHIVDHQPGYRVFSNVFHTYRRTAMGMGFSPDMVDGIKILDLWRRRLRDYRPVAPLAVSDGPLLENVLSGANVDLYQFPAPIWHEQDGGRYLGTGCAVITRDPDDGAVNLGAYRCMLQGKNKMTVKLSSGKHGTMMMDKYHQKGQNCPIAITLGHDPSIFVAAASPVPGGIGEYDFAGFIRQAPIEVIISDETGLPIPATSELVAEGYIPPFEKYSEIDPGMVDLPEGPFGEWPGYLAEYSLGKVPVMVVTRILHRNKPIIMGVPPLSPPIGHFAVPTGAGVVWDHLERADIPGVKGVWSFVYGSHSGFFTVISIKQHYAGQSKQAALAALGCRAGAYAGRFMVVVDDDIDITRPQEVIWALATRCNVREGTDIIKGVWTTSADPTHSIEAQTVTHIYTSDRMILDACWPFERRNDHPKANSFERDFKNRMIEKWQL